jgi:hypothetical protein
LEKIQDTLAPKSREKETTEEIQAAIEQQQAEGSSSFFDIAAPKEETDVKERDDEKPARRKKKHTEVCADISGCNIASHKISVAQIFNSKLQDIASEAQPAWSPDIRQANRLRHSANAIQ